MHFGKWIFLSTACGFLLSQGDKAIFGHYLSLESWGSITSAIFWRPFPLLLARAVISRIMIPLYRDHPPTGSAQDFGQDARLRFILSGGGLVMLGGLALIGPPVGRAALRRPLSAAGAIVVAVALVQMPETIGMTYDQSALAAGDSRGYFWLQALKATVQTVAFLIGHLIGRAWGAPFWRRGWR